jgi:hypothetical protein
VGEHGLGHAEELEQVEVPRERLEVEEERARCVRDVRRVDLSSSELPHEPRVDGAESEASRLPPGQQPFELRRGEVGVGDESRAVADELARELAAALGGAPVLPDDRAVDGLAAASVPDDRRLALVRDPDRGQVASVEASVVERGRRRREHGLPELLGVVLDPARARKVLLDLPVGAAARAERLVDDEARRPGRPLVDRQDQGGYSASSNVSSTSQGAKPWRR